MSLHFGFEPDARRAGELDRRMHADLAASLSYLSAQSAGVVDHDLAAIATLADGIERGDRHAPLTFADYYDCGSALLAEDWVAAGAAFRRLAGARPVAPGLRIDALRDPAACGRSRRMVDMLLEDDSLDMGVLAPADEVAAAFPARFEAGMALLDAACPELAGEVRALVREVVPIASDRTRKFDLDGGSHYRLWGALFLNAGYHPTPCAMAEVIAHESAHSLLFGFSIDEPLTTNDGAAVYASPLRADPRPMDGIYHATFVSARMHYAMSRLLDSGRLDAAAAAQVRAARGADARNFELGLQVVQQHGELTHAGDALMRAARDYMDIAAREARRASIAVGPAAARTRGTALRSQATAAAGARP